MKDAIDQFFDEWKRQNLGLDLKGDDIQFVYRMARVSKILGERLDKTASRRQLTRSQFEALAALRRSHPRPLSAQDLMDASLLTSGSVTAMMKQLLRAGLIERDLDTEDKRRVQVRLTRKGIKTIETALQERLEDNSRIARLLNEKERNQMSQLMRKFLAALEAFESEKKA